MKIEKALNQSKFESIYHKLILNILYSYNWIDEPLKKIIGEYNITQPQYNVLRILKGSHPSLMSPADIKTVMINKKSDLTRLLDRLVAKDLIHRNICPSNRRKMDIGISQKGIQLINELNPKIIKGTQHKIKDHISEEEAKIASNILDKMRG